jgi:hypothetical protein
MFFCAPPDQGPLAPKPGRGHRAKSSGLAFPLAAKAEFQIASISDDFAAQIEPSGWNGSRQTFTVDSNGFIVGATSDLVGRGSFLPTPRRHGSNCAFYSMTPILCKCRRSELSATAKATMRRSPPK